MKKCAIIGAGASGLVAAIEAAKKGAKVTLFEKNSKCGKKLLATGNGRCNITNLSLELKHFHSNSLKNVKEILKGFDADACIRYFKMLGIEIVALDNKKCFPMSMQARTVVEFLIFTCKELGVEISLNSEVLHVKRSNGQFEVKTLEKSYFFDRVLIATGSIASLKNDCIDIGLEIAKSFGHTIHPSFASLVQLITKKDIKSASGVKWVCNVNVIVDNQIISSFYGDVLFASYGLSGLAILDASRDVALFLNKNRGVKIGLDLFPNISKEALRGLLQKRMKLLLDLSLQRWLEGILHQKLAQLVLNELRLDKNIKPNSKIINQLAHGCKNLTFQIESTKGSKSAEVMAGGVSLDEIDPKTMGSKKVNGLYFSGEVLDVDGDCGGYNLHFAWASGIKAGEAMAR